MAMLQPEYGQIIELINLGLLPDDAEAIVKAAAARDHRLWSVAELVAHHVRPMLADPRTAETGIRAWWYYNSTVPLARKRILDATIVR